MTGDKQIPDRILTSNVPAEITNNHLIVMMLKRLINHYDECEDEEIAEIIDDDIKSLTLSVKDPSSKSVCFDCKVIIPEILEIFVDYGAYLWSCPSCGDDKIELNPPDGYFALCTPCGNKRFGIGGKCSACITKDSGEEDEEDFDDLEGSTTDDG
jgi:hypothetical protein